MKVSVIVPCYNEGKFLQESIESVIGSTYSDWECIIIDDGSTDNTKQISVSFCKVDERIRYIYQNNSGVCSARNNAIAQSNGKYILCLDSDDKISSNYIEQCVEELDKDDSLSLVTCNYKLFGRKNKDVILESYSIEKLMGHNLFINCSMFRRCDFDRVGGFNQNMKGGLEDWDLWLSILGNGGKVKYLNEVHFYYRIKHRKKSRNRSVALINYDKLRYQIWENHKDLFSKYYYDPKHSPEYIQVAYSPEYRLGKFLLQPFRFIKNILDI